MRFALCNPTASLYNNRTQMHAAFEFACLDIMGKKLGVPVAELIGGRVRDSVEFASYLFFRYADPKTGDGEVRTPEQLVAQARALKMERERDAEREEYKRERARRGELERQRDERPALPGQAVPLNAQPRRARTPTSLMQPQPPPPPPPRGGITLELPVPSPPAAALSRGAPVQLGGGGPSVADELSRSDLWNFSSGAVGRGARPNGGGAPGTSLPRISQPFNTVAATSLAPEEARALYGNSWVDDDA
jgi:hypothetical protein